MDDLMSKVNTPFMTNQEILENIQNYRISNNSIYTDRIINNFIKLLIKKARKYKRSGVNVGDLIHYGIEGIIEAVNKSYNLAAKEKFITYITIIIERRMKDGLDNQRSAVNFPKNIMTQQRKVRHNYYKSKPNSINNPDTIIYTKMNVEELMGFKDILLNEQLNTFSDSIEERLDKESLQFDVYRILESILTPVEKNIIVHNFGLNGESAKPFDSISSLLEIPTQKVRKIHSLALYKIKENKKSRVVLEKYFI